MKRGRAGGASEKKTPPGRVLSSWVEGEFAAVLEEKAERQGLSLSRYLRHLMIADVENVRDDVILASLKKLERRMTKIAVKLDQFMRNAELVDADD